MGDAVHKPIVLTLHAKDRLVLRGATADEITRAVREGAWESARRGKWHSTLRFAFHEASPVNGVVYTYKTVDVVFADEPERIVVVTVKVYYHD